MLASNGKEKELSKESTNNGIRIWNSRHIGNTNDNLNLSSA